MEQRPLAAQSNPKPAFGRGRMLRENRASIRGGELCGPAAALVLGAMRLASVQCYAGLMKPPGRYHRHVTGRRLSSDRTEKRLC